jgi:hypothetical protein
MLMFAVLAHDFGKPATTAHAERRGQLRWISPGHEAAGGPLAENFLRRIGAPSNSIHPCALWSSATSRITTGKPSFPTPRCDGSRASSPRRASTTWPP